MFNDKEHIETICFVYLSDTPDISEKVRSVVRNILSNEAENINMIPLFGHNNVERLKKLVRETLIKQSDEIDRIYTFGETSTKITRQIVWQLQCQIPIVASFVHDVWYES